ncbi:hypothetical protein Tco_0295537, partial [Tanacetum coccineum]
MEPKIETFGKKVKKRILEENKEPTATHDKPKQQLQTVISHEIKELPAYYSANLQNKLPPKEADPGSFILPCIVGNHPIKAANVPIILGRPMLATAHAKTDVYDKKISLGVGND